MESQKTQSLTTSHNGSGQTPVAIFEKPAYLADIRTNPITYPHYRTIAEKSRKEWLSGQIFTLAGLLRVKDYGTNDAMTAASFLDGQIMRHKFISDYTLVEISEVFRLGLFGEYGEWRGLTVQTLWGFLQKSLNSPTRQEAINLIYTRRQAEAAKAEQARLRAEIEKAKADGSFVPTGKIPTLGRPVYDEAEAQAHRDRVRQQAREILAHARANNPESTTIPDNNSINW